MSGVGLTVPKLLPITGTWVAPFALYNALLSWRTVAVRLQSEVYFGEKSVSTTSQATSLSTDAKPDHDPLEVANRCHLNFLENVPLAFIFLGVAELNGGNRKALNYVMGTLFALRVLHSEFGLRMKGKFGDGGVGRPLGYFGSAGVLLGLSGYAGWLVKGYWGL